MKSGKEVAFGILIRDYSGHVFTTAQHWRHVSRQTRELKVGGKVKVHSLEKAVKLNGKHGAAGVRHGGWRMVLKMGNRGDVCRGPTKTTRMTVS